MTSPSRLACPNRPSPTTSNNSSTPACITREQRGKWAYYRVVEETLTALSQALAPPLKRRVSA